MSVGLGFSGSRLLCSCIVLFALVLLGLVSSVLH